MSARDEAFTEGARLLEDAACDADWTRTPDYCAGLRAGAELLLAAVEKTTGTDTPGSRTADVLAKAADYFEQRRPSRADAVSDFDRGRRATVGWVVEELREMAGEKATAEAATATPFFQPGHTYSREHHGDTIHFLVKHVSTSPDGRSRVAHGWRNRSWDPGWGPSDSDDFTLWADVTEGGDGRG